MVAGSEGIEAGAAAAGAAALTGAAIGAVADCITGAAWSSRATRMRSSPRSTSISVSSVSLRMSASWRTRPVSISASLFSLGAGVFVSAMGASCCPLNRTVLGPAAFLQQTEGGLHGQFVTQRAETRNHAGGDRRHIGSMPEALARGRIRQMAFDDRDRQGFEGVQQGHRGVAVAGGIEDQGVGPFTGLVHLIDQNAFVIGLVKHHARVAGGLFAD